MTAQPQLPPRVKAVCPFGHTTRTRQPEGTQMPCTPCGQEAGRTVMITVPAGPGNRPIIRPPSHPPHSSARPRSRGGAWAGSGAVQWMPCHGRPLLGLPRFDGQG
jgi:hypothetical protein